MNRPLKFRVWCFSTNHWVELEKFIGASYGNINDDPDLMIEQFTGLLDKEGKEIYEGDVVRCREIWLASIHEDPIWHTGTVVYDEGAFRILSESSCVTFEGCKIIGDIHDNPALLPA